jgi:hypothetical protein
VKDRPEIPSGFLNYDELKTQLSRKYYQETDYIERTVLIEAEISVVERILCGLNSYQLNLQPALFTNKVTNKKSRNLAKNHCVLF